MEALLAGHEGDGSEVAEEHDGPSHGVGAGMERTGDGFLHESFLEADAKVPGKDLDGMERLLRVATAKEAGEEVAAGHGGLGQGDRVEKSDDVLEGGAVQGIAGLVAQEVGGGRGGVAVEEMGTMEGLVRGVCGRADGVAQDGPANRGARGVRAGEGPTGEPGDDVGEERMGDAGEEAREGGDLGVLGGGGADGEACVGHGGEGVGLGREGGREGRGGRARGGVWDGGPKGCGGQREREVELIGGFERPCLDPEAAEVGGEVGGESVEGEDLSWGDEADHLEQLGEVGVVAEGEGGVGVVAEAATGVEGPAREDGDP